MKQILCFAGLALSLVLTAAPSEGQADSERKTYLGPSPVVGSWKFETARYREDACVMSGNMHIRPTESQTDFNCSFTAVEDCVGEDKWIVEQTCEANLANGKLAIRSTIVNFIEAEAFTDSYAPDHFALSVISREFMTGKLVSAVVAPIEFRREADNVS